MAQESVDIGAFQLESTEEEIMPSIGSIPHWTGDCLPCIFWFQLNCAKGVFCGYCHFVHPGQKKKRIRRSKNMRFALRMLNRDEVAQ